MRHRDSGVIKDGFIGFSWTTLFFGSFPALFRGDYITFVGVVVVYIIIGIIGLMTFDPFGLGIVVAGIVWARIYNRHYTLRLLERGYVFADDPAVVAYACRKLRVESPAAPTLQPR